MQNFYLRKLIRTLEKNNFYTGSGAVLALAALVISLIALFK